MSLLSHADIVPWWGHYDDDRYRRDFLNGHVSIYLIDVRGHHRITIDPAVHNARAIHVCEKVGFRPVGIMRQAERGPEGWHDILLMDLLAAEFRDPR